MIRVLALALCLAAGPVTAAPQAFRLDTEGSRVTFTYTFMQGERRGTMPIKSADMAIDLRDIGASRVNVTLDPTRAQAGFLFATQAMKGQRVLDTARYPEITFRSTRITGTLQDAAVTGDLTVRGVTRQVTLTAGLYRRRDTDPTDLDRLTVLLTGQIDRRAFGADGYPGYVGPTLRLRIVARIER